IISAKHAEYEEWDYEEPVQIWHSPYDRPENLAIKGAQLATAVTIGEVGQRAVIAIGFRSGMIRAWNVATCDRIKWPLFRRRPSPVRTVAIGQAGGREIIVSCLANGIVRVLDLSNGDTLLSLPAEETRSSIVPVLSVATGKTANRDVIVTGSKDGKVRVWDAVTGILTSPPMACHDGPVNAVAIGRVDERVIIASGSDDYS